MLPAAFLPESLAAKGTGVRHRTPAWRRRRGRQARDKPLGLVQKSGITQCQQGATDSHRCGGSEHFRMHTAQVICRPRNGSRAPMPREYAKGLATSRSSQIVFSNRFDVRSLFAFRSLLIRHRVNATD